MIYPTTYMPFTPEAWVFDGIEVDWDIVLNEQDVVLITDGDNSFALFERVNPFAVEGHIFINPHNRDNSILIGKEMLDWVDTNLPVNAIIAKTRADERHVKLFLRRLGFKHSSDEVLFDDVEFSYFIRFTPEVISKTEPASPSL